MPKLIIGNWKIYPTLADSLVLAAHYRKSLLELKGVEVVIAPPLTWLISVVESFGRKQGHIHFAAQNIWPEDQGAFTGETSAYFVKDIVQYALIGHSERRQYGQEDNDLLNRKVHAALRWQVRPVLCVGEQKKILQADGSVDDYQRTRLTTQLVEGLRGVKADDWSRIVVAYEPVWAIGSGKPATADYANHIIEKLRQTLVSEFGAGAEEVRFIYGGSVTAGNAGDFLRERNIDGLLPGGVSVKAAEFTEICQIAAHLT